VRHPNPHHAHHCTAPPNTPPAPTQHLGDFPHKLAQHCHALYEYTPPPPLAWPELAGDIWCHRYYLGQVGLWVCLWCEEVGRGVRCVRGGLVCVRVRAADGRWHVCSRSLTHHSVTLPACPPPLSLFQSSCVMRRASGAGLSSTTSPCCRCGGVAQLCCGGVGGLSLLLLCRPSCRTPRPPLMSHNPLTLTPDSLSLPPTTPKKTKPRRSWPSGAPSWPASRWQ
jgi:hypothetical protein